MEDFEAFQAAVDSDSSYTSTLTRSLSLVLDEFYKNLRSVGVSAVSGVGMEAFFNAIKASVHGELQVFTNFSTVFDVLLTFPTKVRSIRIIYCVC